MMGDNQKSRAERMLDAGQLKPKVKRSRYLTISKLSAREV
jgi:hypothetical protein